MGFPDIKLLKPLAEALQISVQELMQCKRMEPGQFAGEITDKPIAGTQKTRKGLWLGKYRRVPAAICFVFYALFHALSDFPSFSEQLDWLSPLDRLLFFVTIGAFVYASYREDNHGER